MKWILSISIMLLCGTTMLYSQAKQATIDPDGLVTLENGPLAEKYEVDFSSFDFKDPEEARSYFQKLNVEDVSVFVNLETQVATIRFDLVKKPEWDKAMWTAYLQRYTMYYSRR